jgi:hypothetical protein
MSLKDQIEKEQNAHQSMKWDEMKTGGKEKNVGQVTGTGLDAEDPEGVEAQSVGSGGTVGGKGSDA